MPLLLHDSFLVQRLPLQEPLHVVRRIPAAVPRHRQSFDCCVRRPATRESDPTVPSDRIVRPRRLGSGGASVRWGEIP